jgi:hypothetical protein
MTSNIRSVVTLVSIGTMCWFIALVIVLAMGADAKIAWTCVCGALLGLTGIRYSIRRNKRSGI